MAKLTDAVTLVNGRTGKLQEQTLFLRRNLFGTWWVAKCVYGQTVLIQKGPTKTQARMSLRRQVQTLENNGWSLISGEEEYGHTRNTKSHNSF